MGLIETTRGLLPGAGKTKNTGHQDNRLGKKRAERLSREEG